MKYVVLCSLLLLTACGKHHHHDRPVRTAPVSVPVREGILIAIDPGHGGKDPGATAPKYEVEEKELALKTAHKTAQHLKNLGYRTLMTRCDDTFIELEDRAQMANDANATIFISIHYNAAPSSDAEGVEVFCFRKKTDDQPTQAAILAQDVLAKVAQYTHSPSRGVKEAKFKVLRRSKMPAILVEGGFISNDAEVQRLKTPRHINAVAWGIAQGTHKYLSEVAF